MLLSICHMLAVDYENGEKIVATCVGSSLLLFSEVCGHDSSWMRY